MERINFRKERDLGATMQDAATFIKQHFLKILKPTLIVVIIPLVIGAIIMINGIENLYDMALYNQYSPTSPTNSMSTFFGPMLGAYFFVIVAYILAYVMFIGYMKLYAEGHDDITLKDLLPILKRKSLSLTLSSILLGILMYIGMVFCLIPGIYLSVVFAHFFAISIVEEAGFGLSWKRSFFLIKDNWWSSFGLYIVTYLVSIGLMILFYLPSYIITGFELFTVSDPENINEVSDTFTIIMTIMTPIYYIVGLVMSLLFAVVSTLRYFSLVEQKEGTGERELINEL